MLSGMYVVWWIVAEGRPGARGVSHHHAATASAAGVNSGEWGGEEKRKRGKKSHKHW